MNRAQRRASKANGRKLMKGGWSPFEECSAEMREASLRLGGKGPPEGSLAYRNNVYIVQARLKMTVWGEVTLLMVRRNDGAPVRSWSDMQRIKNEIVGKDRVAVEVYPAEHQLVDDANMYHLWVLPDGMELPFGLHL